ncbi:MAG TPA: TonB-dependent receptor [Blastocatellia bacterium]|nr:TonB-dependent receptor [Blastocatellia bacterium]HMV86611.1 TonB-dependent receptor [Blastocatellia bacterium]HMZ16528.1 TonB-dependent receptor [Blastocatellia bacterium]HNG33454.1 TonB-dependent receptor [Blastocatellia bacterium]
MRIGKSFFVAFALMLFCIGSLQGKAQEFRASVAGQVTDAGGAVLPGAAITARNVATNATYKTTSGEDGEYVLRNLDPGSYAFSVEKAGFRKLLREGIVLQVGTQATLNLQMQTGEVSEAVTIREDIAQLQTETAVRGIVIDQTRVLNTPLQGRNVFAIAWSVPGVQIGASVTRLRPFDIAGSTSIQVNGGRRGQNDVQVDGVTATFQAGNISFVPSVDSIGEFKVITNPFDGQFGFTTGGVVTSVTRSGTNQFHGGLFEYVQNTKMNANEFNSNRAGIRRQRSNINTYGGNINGPIFKNKLFFAYAYEGIRQSIPDPFTTSIPTPLQRTGDFSQTKQANGALQIIYDPLTTRTDATGKLIRDPFPNNIIPANRISPVAKAALAFLPAPNAVGDSLGLNNYVNSSAVPRFLDDFVAHSGRLDYSWSENTKVFGRMAFNRLDEVRGYRYGNEADPSGNVPFVRQNYNGVGGVTHTLNTTTVVDARLGVARFTSPGGNTLGSNFDLSKLGFSQRFISQALNHFSQFRFTDYEGLGSAPARVSPASTVYHFVTTVSKLMGDHSFKTGFEGRLFRNNTRDPGNANGVFNFTAGFTQADPLAGASRASGNPVASFLLGYPASGTIESRAFPARQHLAYAGFFQDDWRVNSKLKLNLGIRYELITGMTDRFNNINAGFDPNAALPVTVPGFTGKGNILYAGVGGTSRSAFKLDKNNLMPRFGLAYQWNDKTVIRGGIGQFYAPVWDDPGNLGFSQVTNLVTGTRVGLPDVSITDPFPTGLIAASRERTNTIGQGFSVFNPQRRIPNVWQYSVEIQRQLPWDMLFSIAGVGSSTRQIQVSQSINEVPESELAKGSAYLTAQVPNPFAGLAPGTGLNGATVQRQQLLRPFPQFTGITVGGYAGGKSQYFGLQSSIQKRFTAGATFTVSHTWAKQIDRINFQNPQDTVLEKQIADGDVTHNVGINGSYELPFGRGRKLLTYDNKIVNGIVGGWTLNGLVRLQSGMPTNFPANAEPVGGIDPIPSNQTIDQWYTQGSFRTLAAFTLRRFSLRYGNLRNPPIRNFDLSAFKTFGITESIKLQFRAELINAMNTPQWFNGPVTNPASGNFGRIGQGATSQSNLPRFVQLALKLTF